MQLIYKGCNTPIGQLSCLDFLETLSMIARKTLAAMVSLIEPSCGWELPVNVANGIILDASTSCISHDVRTHPQYRKLPASRVQLAMLCASQVPTPPHYGTVGIAQPMNSTAASYSVGVPDAARLLTLVNDDDFNQGGAGNHDVHNIYVGTYSDWALCLQSNASPVNKNAQHKQ